MARTVDPISYARQRARILTAAAEEFATNGYDATSTATICRRAQISSGTLFHYFPNKKAVLHALFADDLPTLRALVGDTAATADPDAGLDLLIEYLVAEAADPLSPGLAATVVLCAAQDPELAAVLVARDEVVHQGLTELLQRSEAERPGRLTFAVEPTARWITGLIDASHLDLFDGERTQTLAELETIINWLLGRSGVSGPPWPRGRGVRAGVRWGRGRRPGPRDSTDWMRER